MRGLSSLSARRFTWLALFALGVACAKVDGGVHDESSLMDAGNGSRETTGGAGGKADAGTAGKTGGSGIGSSASAGRLDEPGEAGSAGDDSGGAANVLLSVVLAGGGTGVVISDLAGIACGPTCSRVVAPGTVLSLSAQPALGSVFAGWSGGGCSGTGTCLVTVTAATQVTATFTCAPATVTFYYTGAIASFTVPSCVTSFIIDAYGAQGGSSGSFAGVLRAYERNLRRQRRPNAEGVGWRQGTRCHG